MRSVKDVLLGMFRSSCEMCGQGLRHKGICERCVDVLLGDLVAAGDVVKTGRGTEGDPYMYSLPGSTWV